MKKEEKAKKDAPVVKKSKKALPAIPTHKKIVAISPDDAAKRAKEQDEVAKKHKFVDSDMVVLKGNTNKKFKILPGAEFKTVGFNAKKLIHKNAADFVKVEATKKDKK